MKLVSVYERVDAPAILYRLLAERSTEPDPHVNISHRELPSQADHMRFYLSLPYEHWHLIESEGVVVGYIFASRRNEIGIHLFRDYRGVGLGSQALDLFLATHKPREAQPSERPNAWLANIHPQNEASIALFTRAGFCRKQVTYERS